jgi:hypothetical protein
MRGVGLALFFALMGAAEGCDLRACYLYGHWQEYTEGRDVMEALNGLSWWIVANATCCAAAVVVLFTVLCLAILRR